MLKSLILSAAAAGVAAGLFTAVVQQVTTTPIIIEAERYEDAQGAAGHDHSALAEGVVIATHGDAAATEDEGWSPADGIQRTFYTSLATVVIGVGFGLALLGVMVLSGAKIDARTGLAFGIAGFFTVALAPALGLPPEIPGSGVAALASRQAWWIFTAAATGIGIAGLLLTQRIALQIGGVVLIAVPHIVGAPHAHEYVSTAPAELAGHFAATSLAVTAIFWAVLGFASGSFYERFSRAG